MTIFSTALPIDSWSAIVLGILQGLTEFLPVSSSGHLVLGQTLFGIEEPHLLFDILLHVATLIVVIGFYRRDLRRLGVESLLGLRLWHRGRPWREVAQHFPGADFTLKIGIAMLPTAVIGLLFEDLFRNLFAQIGAVGIAFFLTGVMLMATRGKGAGKEEANGRISVGQALVVGILQGCAIVPGISRAGATIAAGIFLGISRVQAARFSFLLSIPTILGALLVEGSDPSAWGRLDPWSVSLGFLAALVSGYLALRWLLAELAFFHRFTYYVWALALFTWVWSICR